MKRVVVMGKNKVCIEATRTLMGNKGVLVTAVVPCRDDRGEDSWHPSMKKFALGNGLPVCPFKDILNNSALDFFRSLEIDFIFSLQFDKILTESVIEIPRCGVINLHFAPLPKYRGVSPIAWALYNGEKSHGVTLHYIDQGIDTGDIIGQKIFNIEDVRSARELYEICTENGIELFREMLVDILNSNIKSYPQDHSSASYYPKDSFDFTKNIINFNTTTNQLYNWCRAYIFPPFQYPVIKKDDILNRVIAVEPVYKRNRSEPPGTIVKQCENLLTVATTDCYIRLRVEQIR